MTLERAKKKLKKLGLEVGVNSSVYSSRISSGRVVYQNMNAGEKIKKGKKIVITLSKGAAPTPTQAPVYSNSSSWSASSRSNRTQNSSNSKSSASSKSSPKKKPDATLSHSHKPDATLN